MSHTSSKYRPREGHTTVTFPSCETCGAPDPYRCPVCFKFTCWECVNFYSDDNTSYDDCIHEAREQIVDDNWGRR